MTISSKRQLVLERRRIGRNLHNSRKKQNLTLKNLSEKINVRIDLLDRYEIGKNQIRIEMIEKIAKSLDVRLRDMLLDDV